MKIQINYYCLAVCLFLITSQAAAQLPAEAICAVCRVHEGATAPEKVVAMSEHEGEKKVPAFLSQRKLTYPVALDAAESPAWESYKVKVIPAMFLIDREGQIVQQWVGEMKMQQVLQAVQKQI